MSAVSGTIGFDIVEETVHKMLTTLALRGSDTQCVFKEDACLFLQCGGYINKTADNQLFRLDWEGQTYTLLLDGVLYNADEIRSLLISLGHRFVGTTDAEIVIHGYAQWAERCLDRFNGIFTMAVWESKRKKLFLARDRIGVKPLFYSVIGNKIAFASEIKTLLKIPEIRPCLDAQGAVELLMLGPGRCPGSGVFRGIRELEPGCFGYFYCGKWSWKRYWHLADREHTERFEETAEHVRFLLTDAIRRQTNTDEPFGTLLSGGLDSSLISSVIGKDLQERGEQLPTFSVDFLNNEEYFVPGKFQPESDAAYIEVMTDFLGSKHRRFVLTPDELMEAMDAATVARDLPGMADVDASLHIFCGRIRKHVKHALSGECSDEIFGGYPWYRDPEIRGIDGFPWSVNLKDRAEFLPQRVTRQIDPVAFVKEQYKRTVQDADIFPETTGLERRMKQLVNLNHRWFMQTLLDRNDRMSMHNGLEVRVPFCDYRIAEYLYGVPWDFKDHNGREKGLLRYAMREYLPEKVLYRKKSPYPKTYDPGYLSLVSDRLRSILDRKDAPIFAIVQRSALENLLNTEMPTPWYGQLMKLPQTIAHMIQINRWMELYNVDVME